MGKLRILNTRELKELRSLLKEQWGFDNKLDYVFLMNQESDIFITNRDFSRLDTKKLKINSVGLYFGQLKDKNIRLSIEGSQIVGPKATKNVVELTEGEMIDWLKGNDVEKQVEGFVILKHKENYLGCGKAKQGKILNYVPKARRIGTSF